MFLRCRRTRTIERVILWCFLLAVFGSHLGTAQTPTQPTKEYIRAGGKLVAIEILPATAPSITVSVSPLYGTNLGPSATQQFTATVVGSSNQSVTWTVPSGKGTITSGGLYTAPSAIGIQEDIVVRATSVADSSKSADATLTLVPPATVTVTITPNSDIFLGPSNTQQFAASISGGGSQAVTWTIVGGSGTLSTTGFYTAPSTISVQTTVTIRATSVADNTKFANVGLTLVPPTSAGPVFVAITPSNPAPAGPSQEVRFGATVSNASNSAVTWSRSPAYGTIDWNGVYVAPSSISTAQNVTITARSVQDTTKTATAVLRIQPASSTPPTTPLITSFTPFNPTTGDATFQMNAQGGDSSVSQIRMFLGFNVADSGGCLVLYDKASNNLYLRTDAGGPIEAWHGPIVPGSGSTMENSQCKVFGSGSAALNYGNNTQLAVRVQAKPSWSGNRDMRVWLSNANSATWGYSSVGTWVVPATSQYVSPGTVSVFQKQLVQFSAFTSPLGQAVNWSLSPSVGTLNSSGLYLAPTSIASQQTITATARLASNNALVGTASITLKPQGLGGTPPSSTTAYVDPHSSAGLADVFRFGFQDPQGANTIDEFRIRFSSVMNPSNDANMCSFRWTKASEQLELFNDSGTMLSGPITRGTANLSNSSCVLVGGGFSSVAWGGPALGDQNMELQLGIGFQGAFASGTKYIYVSARDNTGWESTWANKGTWSFPSNSTVPTQLYIQSGGYPQGAPTVTQKFYMKATDASGYGDINEIQFVVTDRTTFPSPNTCHIFYFLDKRMSVLLGDDGLQWAGVGEVQGGWSSFFNSQCDFLRGETDANVESGSSTTYFFRPKIRLKGSFATAKALYAKVSDNAGNTNGYQYLGSFTIGSASNDPVSIVPRSETDPITGKRSVWVEVAGAESVDAGLAEASVAWEEE